MAQEAQVLTAPIRNPELGDCHATLERRADGALIVRNTRPLAPYPEKLTQRLEHWAKVAPDRIWLAARENGAWRTITYAQALATTRRIAAALIARGLSAERPLMILSGNDLDHAMLGMGALYEGCAYAPVSPA